LRIYSTGAELLVGVKIAYVEDTAFLQSLLNGTEHGRWNRLDGVIDPDTFG